MSKQSDDLKLLEMVFSLLENGDPHGINTYSIQGGKILIASPYSDRLVEISVRLIED